MTADVIAALETFARNAEKVENADMAHTFRVHRELLRRCAEVGTEAAFLEIDPPADEPSAGPGLAIPPNVLTDELLAVSRELWTAAAEPASRQWWERRISLLERGIALTEGNPDAAPMWATFHVELANTLLNTPLGDRSADTERAIRSFETAARVWTNEIAPQQWAVIQENLGKAYEQRVLGDPEENRALANAHHRAAGAMVEEAPEDDELDGLIQEFGDPLAAGGRRRIEVCERLIGCSRRRRSCGWVPTPPWRRTWRACRMATAQRTWNGPSRCSSAR